MALYKDANKNIHDDMDGKALSSPAWPVGLTQITQQEADAIRAAKQQAAFDALSYADKRRSEYPPMADYLDAVVKGDAVGQQAYIDACIAVKAKYPKV